MLPISHTYVSVKATKTKTPLLVFGSILPDIASTSINPIGRDEIHNSPVKFDEFVKIKFPKLSDLSLGVRLHSPIGGGADYYSDDREIGYAYIHGKKIAEDVAKLIGIPEGNVSLVLAHNFIELAVDLHLYNDGPEIRSIYTVATKEITTELPTIAECLSCYLSMDKEIIHTEIKRLLDLMKPEHFISSMVAVEKIVVPQINMKMKTEISTDEALVITKHAMEITKSSYVEYLNNAVKGVRENILGKN